MGCNEERLGGWDAGCFGLGQAQALVFSRLRSVDTTSLYTIVLISVKYNPFSIIHWARALRLARDNGPSDRMKPPLPRSNTPKSRHVQTDSSKRCLAASRPELGPDPVLRCWHHTRGACRPGAEVKPRISDQDTKHVAGKAALFTIHAVILIHPTPQRQINTTQENTPPPPPSPSPSSTRHLRPSLRPPTLRINTLEEVLLVRVHLPLPLSCSTRRTPAFFFAARPPASAPSERPYLARVYLPLVCSIRRLSS